jgi:hypothetical protein
VPMRGSELRGRAGKQADGSAKNREVKLCAVWSAESHDAQGQSVRDEGSVTYSAAVESATSSVCAIRNFRRKACALLPVWWRRAVR